MPTVKEIKEEILEYYDAPNEPFAAAFDYMLGLISWRRGEVTLKSGIAKLVDYTGTSVVFSVGDQLFRVDRQPSDMYDHDWETDDMYEVEPINTTVVEYQKKDSPEIG